VAVIIDAVVGVAFQNARQKQSGASPESFSIFTPVQRQQIVQSCQSDGETALIDTNALMQLLVGGLRRIVDQDLWPCSSVTLAVQRTSPKSSRNYRQLAVHVVETVCHRSHTASRLLSGNCRHL